MIAVADRNRLHYVRDSIRSIQPVLKTAESSEESSAVRGLFAEERILDVSTVNKDHKNASFMSVKTPDGIKRFQENLPDVLSRTGTHFNNDFETFTVPGINYPNNIQYTSLYWGGIGVFHSRMDNASYKPKDVYGRSDLQQTGLLTADLSGVVSALTVRGINFDLVPSSGTLRIIDRLDRYEQISFVAALDNGDETVSFAFEAKELENSYLAGNAVSVAIPVVKPSGRDYLGIPSKDGKYMVYAEIVGGSTLTWHLSVYKTISGELIAEQDVEITTPYGNEVHISCDDSFVYLSWINYTTTTEPIKVAVASFSLSSLSVGIVSQTSVGQADEFRLNRSGNMSLDACNGRAIACLWPYKYVNDVQRNAHVLVNLSSGTVLYQELCDENEQGYGVAVSDTNIYSLKLITEPYPGQTKAMIFGIAGAFLKEDTLCSGYDINNLSMCAR